MSTRPFAVVLLAMLPAILLLTACSRPAETPPGPSAPTPIPTPTPTVEGEISVPFTTIAVTTFSVNPTPSFITPPEVNADAEVGSGPLWLRDYQIPRNPRLYVLAAPEDVDEAARYLPPETVAAIRATDFDTDAVIVLLRGVGGYGNATFIERIGAQYGSLTVYAQFWTPAEGGGYPDVMAFPFHVVKFKRAATYPVGGGSPSLAARFVAYKVTPTPPPISPSDLMPTQK
mgnify:CR=1 FL=1